MRRTVTVLGASMLASVTAERILWVTYTACVYAHWVVLSVTLGVQLRKHVVSERAVMPVVSCRA
jgi:hypothetical protein